VPEAPIFPYALKLVPDAPVPDHRRSTTPGATASRCSLVDVLQALDRPFDAQTPYMLGSTSARSTGATGRRPAASSRS
jgi:hypothetical protein